VKDFKPGDSVTIDRTTPASLGPTGGSLDSLDGAVRVQAIFDADQTERSHDAGPGNVHSDVLSIELSDQRDDRIELALTNIVEPLNRPKDEPNLRWITYRSELLSKHYGRDVFHRAGVALPRGYNDPNWPRQQWPAIYVVPGYGGRDEAAEHYADMLVAPGVADIAPIAVYVVLDPESPLGHHCFQDSPSNGPRAKALVSEFIPYLESQFRLVAKSEARLVTGHSSGGWSSLWLQLNHPDVFGGCWSTAPDPIDFSAFEMTDIYQDGNIFFDAEGKQQPSYRTAAGRHSISRVLLTVQQECGMEVAIDPDGRSGQQWDSWEAQFSPAETAGPRAGLFRRLFDRRTGAIDKTVAEHWARSDITRMVAADWPRFGPVVQGKVRLACGDQDSFFLNRAVERFQQMIAKARTPDEAAGPGYVLMIEGADHQTVIHKVFQRWNKEMRQHLREHGLQDADQKGRR
jgi:S-formylglutathione hydrolase FrmB